MIFLGKRLALGLGLIVLASGILLGTDHERQPTSSKAGGIG